MSFYTHIPAKCTLAGEHALANQGFGLVMPFNQYGLSLRYKPDPMKTMYSVSAEGNNALQIILWPVIRQAMEQLGEDCTQLTGLFEIQSTIPPCAGLGFSAAICVAVTKWAIHMDFLPQTDLFEFAVKLEDIFHGKSCGMDIAGVLSKEIVQYFYTGKRVEIKQQWRPHLYVSSSDETCFTESCQVSIQHLRDAEPDLAMAIESNMLSSSNLIKLALETDADEGLALLKHGLDIGNECFYDWGLVSPKLDQHVSALKKHALACKIIGAGFGGYVLSLWNDTPPKGLPFQLYKLE